MAFILRLVLILLFFSTSAFAKTYYVCNNQTTCRANGGNATWIAGNDSYNGEYRTSPFLTIKAGVDAMDGSDTLIIGNGTYTYYSIIADKKRMVHDDHFSGSGNTIQAEVNGYVILDGLNTVIDGFQIDVSDLTITGLTFTKFTHAALTLDNSADDNTIEDCLFINIGNETGDNDASAEGLGIGTADETERMLVRRCKFRSIHRNISKCLTAYYKDTDKGLQCYKHDHGIYLKGLNNRVENCDFYGFDGGWAISIRGTDLSNDSDPVIINNTFGPSTNAVSKGILSAYKNPSSTYPSDDIYVYNNIFFNDPNGDRAIHQTENILGTIYFRWNKCVPQYSVIKSNEKWTGNHVETILVNEQHVQTNTFNLSSGDFNLEDYGSADYRITNDSAILINQGKDTYGTITAPTDDFLSETRTGLPDIGAYEYVGSAPADITISNTDCGENTVTQTYVITGTATAATGETVTGVKETSQDPDVTCTAVDGTFGSQTEAYTCTITLAEGLNSLVVQVTDSDSNTDTASCAQTYYPLTCPEPTPASVDVDAVQVYFTTYDAVGVTQCKYRIGSEPDADNGTVITTGGTATGFSSGANTLYVGCRDAAGNWGSDSMSVTYTPPPVNGETPTATGMDASGATF
jgi:hypothetical protein